MNSNIRGYLERIGTKENGRMIEMMINSLDNSPIPSILFSTPLSSENVLLANKSMFSCLPGDLYSQLMEWLDYIVNELPVGFQGNVQLPDFVAGNGQLYRCSLCNLTNSPQEDDVYAVYLQPISQAERRLEQIIGQFEALSVYLKRSWISYNVNNGRFEIIGNTLADLGIEFGALLNELDPEYRLRNQQNGEPIVIEHELEFPADNGAVHYLQVSAATSVNELGEVEIVAVVHDVTSERQMSDRLKSIFEMAYQPLWLSEFDLTTRKSELKEANPAFEQLWGVTDDPLNLRRYTNMVHPDDAEKVATEMAKVQRIGDTVEIPFRINTPSGVKYLLTRIVAIEEGSTPDKLILVGSNTDITDNIRAINSEEQFLTFAERSKDKIFLTNADGILFANSSAIELIQELLGDNNIIHSSRDLTGKTLRELPWPPELEEAFVKVREAYAANSELDQEISFSIPTEDGDLHFIMTSSRGHSFDADTTLLSIRDITDAVRSQSLVAELAAQRHRQEAIKGVLQTVAHDLRGPLTGVMNSSYLIKRRLEGAGVDLSIVSDYTNRIEEQVNRLVERINYILDAQNSIDGHISIVLTDFNAVDAVQTVVSDLNDRSFIEGNGKSVTLVRNGNNWNMRTDIRQFQQILENIVSNSYKYSEAKTSIKVVVNDLGNRIEIRVEDKGIGIPLKEQPHIFTTFYRGEEVRDKSQYKGTGLGLAKTKVAVERLGGTIGFKSTPGKGTTFTVILPKKFVEVEA